jgi:ribose 5-phosphate isomerase B
MAEMIDSREVIPIASDHAGYRLKAALVEAIEEAGLVPLDLGTGTGDSVDYPDYGRRVAEKISRGECRRGVLICGSGIGISIVANKFPGVRAALCRTCEGARLSREHNDANVLVLGERMTPAQEAVEILRTWLETPFAGGRHERRIRKIAAIEAEIAGGKTT